MPGSSYPDQPEDGTDILCEAALGQMLNRLLSYAYKHNYFKTNIGEKDEIKKAMMRRGMIAQSLYALGALLCLVDTYLSITVLIIIQLYFVLGLFSTSPVRRVIKNH